MADVKFEVVEFTTSAGALGSTQDITSSGFGTPKAAIFISSANVSFDESVTSSYISFGVFDGTNQSCSYSVGRDNSTTNVGFRTDSDALVIGFGSTVNGDLSIGYAADSLIPDGVRISLSTAGAARKATVILIGGADVSDAYCDVILQAAGTSPQDVIAPGFEPSMVLFHGCGTGGTLGAVGTDYIHSLGIAINDGSDTQRSRMLSAKNAISTSTTTSYISNTAAFGRVYNDALSWLITVSDFDANGFSFTSSASVANVWMPYLALKFTNDPDISLFDLTIPTSGDYAETTPGFEPTFGLMSLVIGPPSRNTVTTSGSFVAATSVFNDTAIFTESIGAIDALSASSDTYRMLSDGLTVPAYVAGGGSNAIVESAYSFDADGWDFTLSTNPSSPVLGWGLAIGAGGAAPVDSNLLQGGPFDTLAAVVNLTLNEAQQAQELGQVALTQANQVALNDPEQAQSLAPIVLTQSYVIDLSDTEQTQQLSTVSVTLPDVEIQFDGPSIIDQIGAENNLFTFNEDGSGDVDSRFSGTGRPFNYYLAATSGPLPAGLSVDAVTGNIVGTATEAGAFTGIIIEGSTPVAELPAWAAASSEYMVTGAGSHVMEAQYIGEGTPTFSTPVGLLLPDYQGVYVEIPQNTPPWHGARWDNGVAYSDDAGGAPLAVMPSLYAAPAATNLAIQSNDFTNVAWVKTTMTAALDATGLTGSPNTGSKLTATSGNATAIQTVTSALGDYTGRFFLRRVTGVGAVEITTDGTTWLGVSLTTKYQAFEVQANVTNPKIGIRIVTSGDEVEVGNGECYAKTIAQVRGSAPIVTEGTAVTNTQVECNFDITNHDNAQGGYFAEYTPLGTQFPHYIVSTNTTSNGGQIFHISGNTQLRTRGDSNSFAQTVVSRDSGIVEKYGAAYQLSTGELSNRADYTTWADAIDPYVGFGLGAVLEAPHAPNTSSGAFLARNIQRWDLPYTDAKAKIDELMV